MTPKLIALDLDGTLLNAAGELSARTRAAVGALRARGIKLVLSTGRPPRHVEKLATELNLADLVVAYNGAAIVNFKTDETQYRYQLDAVLARELIATMRKLHPDIMIGIETHHGWYLDETLYARRQASLFREPAPKPKNCGDVESFIEDKVIKIFFRHDSLEAAELSEPLHTFDVYATWTSPSLLEVLHPQVNKQECIAYLANQFGIAQEDTVAFGDQHNDKELISWAGYGVAMDNASDELKAIADFVTASHNQDGVAKVLERWI